MILKIILKDIVFITVRGDSPHHVLGH